MLAKSILALTVVVAIALQFVPVERTNPLGAGGPNVSENFSGRFAGRVTTATRTKPAGRSGPI